MPSHSIPIAHHPRMLPTHRPPRVTTQGEVFAPWPAPPATSRHRPPVVRPWPFVAKRVQKWPFVTKSVQICPPDVRPVLASAPALPPSCVPLSPRIALSPILRERPRPGGAWSEESGIVLPRSVPSYAYPSHSGDTSGHGHAKADTMATTNAAVYAVYASASGPPRLRHHMQAPHLARIATSPSIGENRIAGQSLRVDWRAWPPHRSLSGVQGCRDQRMEERA